MVEQLRVSASNSSLGIVSDGFGGVSDSTTVTVGISAFCSCGTVSTGLGVLCSVVTVGLFDTKSLPEGVVGFNDLDGHPQF